MRYDLASFSRILGIDTIFRLRNRQRQCAQISSGFASEDLTVDCLLSKTIFVLF